MSENEKTWSESHSHWDEHPEFLVEDWLYEVNNGDTRQGYGDWVDARIEAAAEDDPEP